MIASDPGGADPMLAYVLCQNPQCRYVLISEDLRGSPHKCPRCGTQLLTNCPRCGALYRQSSGMCDNCGRHVFVDEPVSPADVKRFAWRLSVR